MRRIIIIGVTGSGKTTLGKVLSSRLGMPSIDLDDINWLPGWQTRDLQQARQMVDEATQKPGWVISGNYSKLQDIFWGRADTLIWLDYSMPRTFWQLLRRSLLRMTGKQVICNGNVEKWQTFFFSKESIMVWFFKSYRRRQEKGRDLFAHPEQNPHLKTMLRFRHPQETQLWLESLSHGTNDSLLAA